MLASLCRALIAIGSAVVPAAVRDDWTREWRAELWYATEHRAAPPALVFRCAGALVHALWLRKEEWSLTMVLQDVRYAVRALRVRPGFAAVAILTLAVGIGANTAVFSVVHGVLLKPLPYDQPDRLVQIWEVNPARNWTHETVAPANFLDWKVRTRSFTAMAYYIGSDTRAPGLVDVTLTGTGDPERLRAMTVSSNFFAVLGTVPSLGRTFQADEHLAARSHVAVLSDAFWRRRFGGDRAVVGRTVVLNGVPTEVVGIMPRAFHVPAAAADVWLPHAPNAQFPQMRRPHWLRVIARLAPGVSLAAAQDDLSRIASDLEREYPDTNAQMSVGLGPLHEWFVGDTRKGLLALMGAVGLVLLVACTNVASLLLARATARRQEIAIRVALGAGRNRLVRQVLTEGLVLAACGAAAGVLLAFAALTTLSRIGPTSLPRLDQIAIDGTVLAVVVATICMTTVLFGIVPAWQSARTGSDSMRQGSRGGPGSTAAARRALIIVEVALSVVLLVGAGLLLRSFERLSRVDPGIDRAHALSFRISAPARRYDSDAKVASFFTEVVERLRTIPGVRAAGASVRLALEGRSWTGDLLVDGQPDVWGRELRHKAVTPGYFEAAGIRLVRGRDFSSADLSGAPVVIVNQALVRLYFADVDPVGQRISFDRDSPSTSWRTIVGVVGDEKQDGLAAQVKPEVYDPHTEDAPNTMSIVVRTAADPLSALAAARREVAALDSAVAIYDVRTLEDVVQRSLSEQRFTMLALGAFAAVALILATVGVYGVIAFTVGQRRREIGVRLALGARRTDVVRMVVGDGVRLVLAGLAIGAVSATIVSRSLAGFLFEIGPADPLVLVTVAALLSLAGAVASYVPARRASLIDPAVSLRID